MPKNTKYTSFDKLPNSIINGAVRKSNLIFKFLYSYENNWKSYFI